MSETLLLTGIRELLTLRGPVPRRGRTLAEPGLIHDAAVLVRNGFIAAVGRRRDIVRRGEARRTKRIDFGGCVVLPGFVDSHTHLIFPAGRTEDYEKRITGASYEEIARAGGGILSTVHKLRLAGAVELKRKAIESLQQIAAHGTTTLEAKSGYGLNLENELKTLRLLRELRSEQPLEIAPTFLGAHVVPKEYRRQPEAYVKLLVRHMIPIVARRGLAEFCDVYCDRGAFTVEEARVILTAGRVCGLEPRMHAEQIARTGATQLAVALNAASADHLEKIGASDIRALARSNVVATLLPGCCFHLGLKDYPPARKLIDAGAIVALATDYNPGTSPTLNMQMILSLACTQMRMTPAEAIAAATINPAYSLRRHSRIGSVEVGKQADLAVFDVADYREIPYYFGVNQCHLTMKRGKVVHGKQPRFA